MLRICCLLAVVSLPGIAVAQDLRASPEMPELPRTFEASDYSINVVEVAAGFANPWSLAFLPDGDILEIMQDLLKDPDLKNDVYVRGRFIKYLRREGRDDRTRIPSREIYEESPTLEDIFLYYERSDHAGNAAR